MTSAAAATTASVIAFLVATALLLAASLLREHQVGSAGALGRARSARWVSGAALLLGGLAAALTLARLLIMAL